MQEIWKDIEDYEGLYQVSNFGRIKSLPRNTKNQYSNKRHIFNPCKDSDGYLVVGLSKNKQPKTLKVHRLVAIAFIPNILNKPQINHIDCDKTNNNVNNLEWVTSSENIVHAYKNKLITINSEFRKKKIYGINTVDNSKITFGSVTEASKFFKTVKTSISNCLNGRTKSSNGYKWFYE